MYLLAPFILQNLKKTLRANPELWGCAIFGAKMAHLSWTKFFGANHYYYFHLPIGPFHCAKLKRFLQRVQSYEDAPSLGPKWSICTNFFFGKLLVPLSSTYKHLLLCKIFKNFFLRIQSYEDVQFLGPK